MKQQCGKISNSVIKKFGDFPLSENTLRGLTELNYIYPTDIQRDSILLALNGNDILGSAITGSGKTLAFLIPVLENLYVHKWTNIDGVGAIIISPTRELAYQIFSTLKKVGKYHDFSAGLIIGGKNLKFEKKRMDKCNILICTPGRLLQHMDENPLFCATNMKMLVLDEADRCLDMGFERTINAIIESLQPERQTLLFSATQTNSVRDLARLSLSNAIYVGSPQHDSAIPELLQQNYVVIALEDKLTMLWSFLKNHLRQKCIVFFASCKQVKFVYEIFCKLRPGTSLLALYGTLHQDRRIAIYEDFKKKKNAVLFATDIASRGLDFPAVNWVVQLDCPEDVTQYIHRAGRSARNKASGESLLVLMPSEELTMINEMKKQNINVKKMLIDPKKLFSPRAKIEAFLAQSPELKATAKRAFVAYIKSIYWMKNKKLANALNLNYDTFAKSMGLVVTPRIRFLEKKITKGENKKNDSANKNGFKLLEADSNSDSEELFTVKRINYDNYNEFEQTDVGLIYSKKEKLVTKAALAKKSLKKGIISNISRKFDEEGSEIKNFQREMQSELFRKCDDSNFLGGINIEISKQLILEEDKFDKNRLKEINKIKHKSRKQKFSKNNERIFKDECDDSVDLSWLPNPDILYNNSNKSLTNASDITVKKRKLIPRMSLIDAEKIAAEMLLNTK